MGVVWIRGHVWHCPALSGGECCGCAIELPEDDRENDRKDED